ncbi:MAG: hypothetical protein BGO49_22105 [Planctomycetales bacterium 71-10]|nr:MAG: hypothetical protein BGO49_22105 [Planctomycetales bacterium 71-10]
MNLYVGTSGYSYKPWKGSFYPAKIADKDMLRFYGERFRTVEINSSFYGMPKLATLESWAGSVPEGFRFVLKSPKLITHERRLKDVGEQAAALIEGAGALADRMGPLLFQLPPNMKKDAARLGAFLATLPAHARAAFEFRHASWFDAEILGMLRDRNAALCLADADDDLDVPFEPTADWGYLRLRRPDYDDAGLRPWSDRVRAQDWSDAFVFFKHEDAGRGPVLARRFLELAA